MTNLDLTATAQAGDAEAQLALAQTLDRQGRREEALSWLRRAAEGGHPVAQTLLGVRLITTEKAEAGRLEGIGFLVSAHEAGLADATTMVAVLNAIGAGMPQSWDRAFDLMQLAAERGSNRGRAQLFALAREHGFAGDPADFAAQRAVLTAEPWLVPPEPEVLSETPYIAAFRGFLSPTACAWIVERARGRTTRAQVFDDATGQGRVERERSNSAFQVNPIELDLILALTRARIAAAAGADIAVLEPPQILNYQVGEAFTPHVDYLDPAIPGLAKDLAARGQRSATLLVYLNADYEGGETEFPELGLKFRGHIGDALLFRNLGADGQGDPRTRHAGRAPTQGEKWLLSQWIRDR